MNRKQLEKAAAALRARRSSFPVVVMQGSYERGDLRTALMDETGRFLTGPCEGESARGLALVHSNRRYHSFDIDGPLKLADGSEVIAI